MAAASPPELGSALLYWWPDEGWQLGRIRRRCRRAPFTHIVGYRTPPTAASTRSSIHLRLSLGLADPARSPPPDELPPVRPPSVVSSSAGSVLSVRRTSIKGETEKCR